VLHVSTPLPEHRVAPGVQTPVQALPTQAWPEQGVAAPHWPVALHVSVAALPEHCTAPGTHTPWHEPPTQA
jgi:hypothetical protein